MPKPCISPNQLSHTETARENQQQAELQLWSELQSDLERVLHVIQAIEQLRTQEEK